MKLSKKLATLGLALGLAASAQAANVIVNADITTSTTWTADNVYDLQGIVYVDNGATLTIQAGTQIKSTTGLKGTLVITRGCKIYALGTATKPIVFTSTSETGADRASTTEWGNLTICGQALVGAEWTADGGAVRQYTIGVNTYSNTPYPTGVNLVEMEGITAGFVGDDRNLYGGADDNDDSGTLAYVSLRFGGQLGIIGNSELNGLSMGGVGRNTDVHHIDVFSNLDDGIETWGGTVNYKYLSLWYIGDDSFDVDQGWRGKAQFGLIVQGWGKATGSSGSGISDNCIEMDGAESNTAVPATTATIYNFTVIGQPDEQTAATKTGGDYAIALRDNARVQFRNMIFIDIGENVLVEERAEGTTASGNWRYGQGAVAPYNTTPLWNNTANGVWGLPYTAAFDRTADISGKAADHVNNTAYLTLLHAGEPGLPGTAMTDGVVSQLRTLYPVQTSGTLCEISDTLFFNCLFDKANTVAGAAFSNNDKSGNTNPDGADDVGVTVAGASNPAVNTVVQSTAGGATLPIMNLTRGTPTALTPANMVMAKIAVGGLDPRRNPANAATVAVASAPNDGFFTPADYRGAFSDDTNWCLGWTAASQYGLFDTSTPNPSNPQATVVAFGTSFQTEVGKNYVVESSTDGVIWTPVSVIVGDGSIKSISPLTANTLYRVSVQ